MENKKKPIRMCIACREHTGKRELVRIVRNKDGGIAVDLSGKMPGRGAYICKDTECLKNAEKKKSLDRALKCTISEELYEKLKEEIK